MVMTLLPLKMIRKNFTYFEHELEGQTHLQSTIECTRSGGWYFWGLFCNALYGD